MNTMNTMNNQNNNETRTNTRAIMLEPGKCAYETRINTELRFLQRAVDGLIEVLYLDDDTILVCNDEGKINGMRPNRAIRDEDGNILDFICGPFVIARNDDESEDGFGEMTDEQVEKYLNKFYLPEDIFIVGNEIMAFKYDPSFFEEEYEDDIEA